VQGKDLEFPDRLDFTLPDFTRFRWVSDRARVHWEPRLQRISEVWAQVEWRSVCAGIRRCALVPITPRQLVAQAEPWIVQDLVMLPLAVETGSTQPYVSNVPPASSQGPEVLRVVIGARSAVLQFKSAWAAGDNETIGDLLGYPPCCRAFFAEVWVRRACVDTTWPMASNTRRPEGHIIIVAGPRPWANVLGRWFGVRAVPHLPCRFDCLPTFALAESMLRVGRDCGFDEEMGWIEEILSWPVEWSALHGIAEIKFPVLSVSTRTDATPRKYTVRWEGTSYPAEAVSGVQFPYARPPRLRVSESPSFRRGMEHLTLGEPPRPGWYHTDNGFTSYHAMHALHRPLVALARDELTDVAGHIIDLGCGNGALLEKICRERDRLTPHGIDVNPQAVDHTREILPGFTENFRCGDFFATDIWAAADRSYAMAILMIGRLLEVPHADAQRLLEVLAKKAERLLMYMYPGYSDDDFEPLVTRLGLTIVRRADVGNAALIRV
jgi:hypothetical protein